jgi:hypothetical protein
MAKERRLYNPNLFLDQNGVGVPSMCLMASKVLLKTAVKLTACLLFGFKMHNSLDNEWVSLSVGSGSRRCTQGI